MSRVTTFYSYKGGSGRSMAMANVAWALATNGERVLAIDWDLEAPGIHRYFHPFLSDPEQVKSEGLIDRVWDYVDLVSTDAANSNRFALARCDDLVQPLELPLRPTRKALGCLHLLGAGRQDDQYSEKVGGLDWADFYERFDGRQFIDRLIRWARENYTHVLIDSRTGVADTAGICTSQLPDSLVLCLVYNRQSIEGSASIARSILSMRRKLELPDPAIFVLPGRVEDRSVIDAARRHTAAQIARALKKERNQVERAIRRDEVRHYPWCAFEEKLAVFEESPDERGSMLEAMHELAARISSKQIKIAKIDAVTLASIWRRAAFDDPRIADLQSLNEAPAEAAQEKLLDWLKSAVDNPNERVDWLISLGEVAVRTASTASENISSTVREALATNGLRIANRAYEADSEQYRTSFALLLQVRAAQLQKRGEFVEAFELARRSAALFERQKDSGGRSRRARALERVAEILIALGDRDEALRVQREAVEEYRSVRRRDRPLGTDINIARSMRVLAEMLMEQGEYSESAVFSDQAISFLNEVSETFISRNQGEVVRILSRRAEIAVTAGDANAASEIIKVRLNAQRFLKSEVAYRELEARLRRIEAELLIRDGQAEVALTRLESLDLTDVPPRERARLTETWAAALMLVGRAQQAAELLISAVQNPEIPLLDSTLDELRRALRAIGREVDATKIVIDRLLRSNPNGTVKLNELLRYLNEEDWVHLQAALSDVGRQAGED